MSDYLEAMTKPLPRGTLAVKVSREALAERVADHLVRYYPEPRQLELIAEALDRRRRETGKIRELMR